MKITIDCLMQQFKVDTKGEGVLEVEFENVPNITKTVLVERMEVPNSRTLHLGNVKVIIK